MKTIINLLTALAVSCLAIHANAQVEVGLNLGVSTYEGDLAPKSRIDFLTASQGSYGAYVRANVGRLLSMRGFVQSSRIQGSDAMRPGQEARNLSFRTNIFELGLLAEIYPLGVDAPITPYISAGASVYNFNPEANYNGSWVELQPLGTEGQGLPGYAPKYELTRFAVPLGVGVRYPLGDAFVLGVEGSARLTFFDYLDDVSGNYVNYYTLLEGRGIEGSRGNGSLAAALADRTGEFNGTEPRDLQRETRRGDPTNNDWFYTGTITIGYRIGSGLFSSGGSNRGNSSRYNRCYEF